MLQSNQSLSENQQGNTRPFNSFNPDPTGITRPVTLRPVPLRGVSVSNPPVPPAPVSTRTPLEIWNEKMHAWLDNNANQSLVESHIIEAGLDWLLSVCAEYGVNTPPNCLITNGIWQSLGVTAKKTSKNHVSGGDKASYVAQIKDFNGAPNLLINFHSYKAGGTTETFSSGIGMVSRFYNSQIEGTAPVPAPKFVPKLAPTPLPLTDDKINAQKAAYVRDDLKIFELLPSTPQTGDDLYFQNKRIQTLIPNGIAKFRRDKHGQYAAILLKDARDDKPVGLQRFYDRIVYTKDGHPIGNKKFTWGLGGQELQHAHLLLGKIDPHGAIIVCEGFADGIVLHAATNWPVIVALKANNLEPVSQAFHKRYPLAKFIFALDNDHEKYDHANNTGMLAGIHAAQKVDGRFALPGKHKDFCDLYNSLIPKEIMGTFQYWAIRAAIRTGELEPTRKAIAQSEILYGICTRIEIGTEMSLDIADGLKLEGLMSIGNKLPRPLLDIRKIINRAEKAPAGFDWAQTKIALTGLSSAGNDPLKSLKQAISSAVFAGIQRTPYHQSIESIHRQLITSLHGVNARIPELTHLQQKSLTDYLDGAMKSAVQKTLSEIKCIPSETVLKRHNVHVGLYPDYKDSAAANEITKSDNGLKILIGTHGTGKTSVVMRLSVEKAKKLGQNVLFGVHRTTLAQDGASALDIAFYQDIKTSAEVSKLFSKKRNEESIVEQVLPTEAQKQNGQPKPTHKVVSSSPIEETPGLSICVNSLLNGRFEELCLKTEVLLIDEIRQVLFHIATGTVTNADRTLLYRRLQAIIRNAKKVVVGDADVDDFVIKELELARPGEKFDIYINTYTHGIRQKLIVHKNKGQFAVALDKCVKNGQHNYVTVDSKNSAKAFHEQAKSVVSDPETVRCITRENTKDGPNHALFRKINDELKTQKIKNLVSTAIPSGVSITVPWFDNHFGLFNATVSPTVAWQMLRRDRTAIQYEVFLSPKQQRLETNPEVLLRQIEKANSKSRKLLQSGGQLNQDNYSCTDFDKFYCTVVALENAGRNDFANQFLRLAVLDGIEIEFVDNDIETRKMGNQILKQAKADAQDSFYRSIIGASKLNETDIQRLKKQNEHTSAESDAITNFLIRDTFCVDNGSEADIDFWDDGRGLPLIRSLELTMTPRDVVFQLDLAEQNNPNLARATMHFNLQRRGFLRHILDFIGAKIDETAGTIDLTGCAFTASDALKVDENGKTFIDRMLKYQDEFNALGLGVKISEKIRSRPARMIVAVLNAMGIYTKSRQKRTSVVSNLKKMQVVSIAEGGIDGNIDIKFNNGHGLNVGEKFSLVKMKKVENSSYAVKSVIDLHTVRVEGKYICDSTGFWKKGGQRNHIHYIDVDKSGYALDAISRRFAAGKNFFKKKLSELMPAEEMNAYPMPESSTNSSDELANSIVSQLDISPTKTLGIDWLSLVLGVPAVAIVRQAREVLFNIVEVLESNQEFSISLCNSS